MMKLYCATIQQCLNHIRAETRPLVIKIAWSKKLLKTIFLPLRPTSLHVYCHEEVVKLTTGTIVHTIHESNTPLAR